MNSETRQRRRQAAWATFEDVLNKPDLVRAIQILENNYQYDGVSVLIQYISEVCTQFELPEQTRKSLHAKYYTLFNGEGSLPEDPLHFVDELEAHAKKRQEAEHLAQQKLQQAQRQKQEQAKQERLKLAKARKQTLEEKIRKETEKKILEEVDKKHREEAEKREREAAQIRAKEEAERKAQKEIERKKREEEERLARIPAANKVFMHVLSTLMAFFEHEPDTLKVAFLELCSQLASNEKALKGAHEKIGSFWESEIPSTGWAETLEESELPALTHVLYLGFCEAIGPVEADRLFHGAIQLCKDQLPEARAFPPSKLL